MWSEIKKSPFLKAMAVLFLGVTGFALLLRWMPG